MCLFSILCSAKTTNSKNNNNNTTNNNQLPPCLSSQLLPESASALKHPTPLMSAAVECLFLACMQLCACVRVSEEACRSPAEQTAARTMHTQEVGTESKKGHSARTAQYPQNSRLWCHFNNPQPRTPDHLSNNSLYSLSSQWTESGN